MNFGYPRGPNYGNRQNRSFYLQEDIPSRIDQLVVGASELRLTQVLADVPVSGGFEGTLESEPNQLRGTLVNRTGIEIERPSIWYDNQMYAARVEGNQIRIEEQPPRSVTIDPNQYQGNYYAYNAGRSSAQSTPEADEFKRRSLYDHYLNTLLLSNEDLYWNGQPQPRRSSSERNSRLPNGINMPPLLIAWAKTGPIGTVAPDATIAKQGGATIIVADINVHRNGSARRVWYDAPTSIVDSVTAAGVEQGMEVLNPIQTTSRRRGTQNFPGSAPNQNSYRLKRDQGPDVEILITPEVRNLNPGNLVIAVTFNGPYSVEFRPKDKGPEWTPSHMATDAQGNRSRGYYNNRQQQTYDLPDWQSYTDPATGKLSGKLFLEEGASSNWITINVEITAKILADEPANKNEDWKPWQ